MKKKVFSIILALAMVLLNASFVFADKDNPPQNVDVKITMEVKRSSASDEAWSPERVKEVSSATVDFRARLDTTAIKSALNQWYDFGQEYAKALANGDAALEADIITYGDNRIIDGTFTVTIDYPSAFSFSDTYLEDNKDMFGFNEEAKKIFHEVSRTVEEKDGRNIITIQIATNAPGSDSGLLAGDLHANAEEYLPELIFEVDEVTVSKAGVFTVYGAMAGQTTFASLSQDATVKYKGVSAVEGDPDLDASVVIVDSSSTTGNGGGGGGKITPVDTTGGNQGTSQSGTSSSVYNIDGSTYSPSGGGAGYNVSERDGWEFSGWYKDPEMTIPYTEEELIALEEQIEKDKQEGKTVSGIRAYGHWISTVFKSEDHFAYVIGYPDGTVKPLNNITREEVATILYRLLTDETRDAIYTDQNDFPDVEFERWSNRYISSMANGEYVLGYEDGTFGPARNITRAEFATMIVRYAKGVTTAEKGKFTDIAGHWAENYILTAAGEGWIAGYEDGSFAPDKLITRAEAMTILNRMLIRKVDGKGIHADAIIWPDNPEDAWYHYAVEEATNSHDYTRQEDGLTENWTEMTEGIDWYNY